MLVTLTLALVLGENVLRTDVVPTKFDTVVQCNEYVVSIANSVGAPYELLDHGYWVVYAADGYEIYADCQ